MNILARLHLAFGFMTRLVPPRHVGEPSEFVQTLPLFPVVGLVLGLLQAVPWYFALLDAHPWVQAGAVTAFGVWATRGLHWDGWADLMDAWGSGATGERFWTIMKDSRCGAFGVMGIVLGMGAQCVLLHEALSAGMLGAVVFAPVLGRGGAVLLAAAGTDLTRPGMGRSFIEGANVGVAIWVVAVTVALGVWLGGGTYAALALVLLLCGLAALRRIAVPNNGLNGDFLGAAIIWGELAALLAALF